MPARFRISSPAATSAPPIQLASTGLPSCLAQRLQLLGDLRGIGHGLRRENHQHAVAVGIFGRDLERLGVALRRGVAEDVHGIVVAPVRRQDRVERFHGLRREIGQLAAAGDQRVGGQHARTAGVGDDGQARPRGRGCLASTSAM